MKKEVIALFKITSNLKLKSQEIAQRLNITEEHNYQALKAALNKLVNEGELERSGKRYFRKNSVPNQLVGKLELVRNGDYGFVKMSNKRNADVFIAQRHLIDALNGDTVEINIFHNTKGKNLEGKIVKVINREKERVIGILKLSDSGYYLQPDNKNERKIIIPEKKLFGAKQNDKILTGNFSWNSKKFVLEGEVIEVFGKHGTFESDIAALLNEFGLSLSFPKGVTKEVKKINKIFDDDDLKNRTDLRSKTVFTIDPIDAKDFDDAVSIEILPNENYMVGIHIADVSHYVKMDGDLDSEAYQRGNSVYLVGMVVPMLPEILSNDICSLKPNEDRLTYSVFAELTPKGKLVKYDINKSIINSKRRFTYEDAQQIIDQGIGDFHDELVLLNSLAKVLRKKRMSKGSINFSTEEVIFEIDKQGVPLNIKRKQTLDTNNLIEEYMLLANQIVAGHILLRDKKNQPPFVYRVHDVPDRDKLDEFSKFVKTLGYNFSTTKAGTSKAFQQLLENIKDTDEEALINDVAIRTMAKAVYSAENIGHYGLGFKYYTHFTSPIRRYPDLIVHRLLNYYIENDSKHLYNADRIDIICNHTSATERNAINAERLSVKLKQIEYLNSHIGEEFEAIISGVTFFGIFVKITDLLAEGLIRLSDLNDDYYEFQEKNYCVIGRRTKRKFTLGDKVTVKLIRIDKEKREIDFSLTE